jgi:FkbM family methyltransferase
MDIMQHALKMDKNLCIIDCGAHIGDGIIPIAHALQFYDRNDITLYAIEPDIEKCKHIKYLVELNNLKNVIIINKGLSDKEEVLYDHLSIIHKIRNNTGASVWSTKRNKSGNHMNFDTLDNLVNKNFIKHKIGIIHLDVEGMEDKILQGNLTTILKDMPYLSIEDNTTNNSTNTIEILQHKYKYNKRFNSNNTFIKKD